MPYVDNHGVQIHYELEGHGVPVVLQYGQYFPLDIWHEHHYVRVMKEDCRLILVDARGHGDSDKPYDPEAYRIELMASDIIAVLDVLGIPKAHYMGYSSGGFLGFSLAKLAQERCLSLILGGTAPYAGDDDGTSEVRPCDWTPEWSKIMKRRGGLVGDLAVLVFSGGVIPL